MPCSKLGKFLNTSFKIPHYPSSLTHLNFFNTSTQTLVQLDKPDCHFFPYVIFFTEQQSWKSQDPEKRNDLSRLHFG